MSSQPGYRNEPIAIIGSSCRFPGGSSSPSKLWELLRQPRDVLSEIPSSRFNVDKFYHPDPLHHGTSNVRHSYLLSEDHRVFDAQFFGVKPIEANAIDPQQRLLLETTYEALESAGLAIENIQGSKTGVFVGLMNEDYSSTIGCDLQNVPTYFASGTARSIMANRVSYFFDFHGPSMVIDTACSSSLVALHQAVTSLRDGESCVAVVAGSNLLLGPEYYVAESKLHMLSPTGRSRMWDKDADGYARGDGFGILVLKTLSQALADQDSIECIVRETGVNQDGRTKGITMPSPLAQAQLIRDTYAKAGLDLSKSSDRPQYFEAHGTGTAAGDPVEAEAISTVFFGAESGFKRTRNDPPLFVGSVKTVIGHSEGTAGIAGVLKASLALQHGTIPPNLLLNELNPKVAPFYGNLRIPQEAQEWPAVEKGSPRRASVNSFGFGGSNAHAILENFVEVPSPSTSLEQELFNHNSLIMPFNFSAASEKALLGNLAAYASYVRKNSLISLRDLAWTLNTRRSTLPTRVSISASTAHDLAMRLEHVSKTSSGVVTVSSPSTNTAKPRILGVFTGQGAQWATMGAQLLQRSSIVAACFDSLQESLDTLPPEHTPTWSLKAEILKDPSSSRIGQGEISQPLCTAVQIALVNLLRAAKIDLAVAVGHSSGEIAAAYAAGYLSAKDAIRVAYYRGLFLKLSGTTNEVKGAMVAVGTSYEDAQELCELPSMEGRICIAANNSPTSLTLSGDVDAIEDAQEILEDEKKFARILKVDKAYHSHHMLPCAAPYIAALENCGIEIRSPPSDHQNPAWVSSVTGEKIASTDSSRLVAGYWADNMVQTVLFRQAIEYAIGAYGPLDVVVEIGPHPALRGPISETIQGIYGQAIPYTGTLLRGSNDVETFSDALGSLWKSFGEGTVDFDAFDRATHTGEARPPKLLKGLPTYSWVHDRIYWHETRYSKAYRVQGDAPHQLLGTICPQATENEFQFRNYLSPREVPWLVQHKIQGQIVFPAAGYVSSVVEAIARLYPIETMDLVELSDITIGQALFLPEDSGVETLLSLKLINNHPNYKEFVFSFYSCNDRESNTMIENGSGKLRLNRGIPLDDSLPPPYAPGSQLVDVETERFYSEARGLGFGYEGPFHSLCRASRKADEAVGFLEVPEYNDGEDSELIIHPGILDSAVQSILIAYCYPGDGRMRHPHVPTRVDSICISLSACRDYTRQSGTELPFYSSITSYQPAGFVGDVEIHSAGGNYTIIQLQGLHETSLIPPSSDNDVNLFSEITWGPEVPTGISFDWEDDKYADDRAFFFLLERVGYYYLRKLGEAFPRTGRHGLRRHHTRLLNYVDDCLEQVAAGRHPVARKEWNGDSEADVFDIIQRNPLSIDLHLMKLVGDILPHTIQTDSDILEALAHNSMLHEFRTRAFGIATYYEDVARMARQLSHRFAHMNILEIGSNADGATASILGKLDGAFGSYTYTDISNDFLAKAQEQFTQYISQMSFSVLDIEKPIADQGYTDGSYDLVIACLVLHRTQNLEQSLSHVRRILKPGGYLILLEITDSNSLRFDLVFGALPNWWASHDDEQKPSPSLSTDVWEDILRRTGFSGADAITSHSCAYPAPLSVMACQAIDTRLKFLREPLESTSESLELKSLTIIGGDDMSHVLYEIVGKHYDFIQCITSMADIATTELPFLGSVVSLVDLEEMSVFQNITDATLRAIQSILKQSKRVLWVSHGARSENPYKNMFLGIQRTVALEMTHVQIQFLDFATPGEVDFVSVAKRLLQLEALGNWEERNQLKNLLWHNEPDTLIQDGRATIPRLRLSHDRNSRYNAARRLLTHKVDCRNTTLSLRREGSQLSVEEKMRAENLYGTGEIQLSLSLLKAVRVTETNSAFLSIGRPVETDDCVIVLSNSLDSRVYAPVGWSFPAPRSREHALKALISLYTHILARSILAKVGPGKSIAVFNPGYTLGEALAKLSVKEGVQLTLLTTRAESCARPWTFVHSRATRRSIQRILPTNISTFVDMDEQSEISVLIQNYLLPNCRKFKQSDLVGDYAQLDHGPISIREVSEHVQSAWLSCLAGNIGTVDTEALPKLDLNDITWNKLPAQGQAVVSWDTHPYVDIQVQPANRQVSFAQDKTYWLVGLTGGLGLSLCQWMANRGARYIALSSRNPSIDHEWLIEMETRGCTVRVFSNDITSRKSVRDLHRKITETMPPIAGVAQGAMVLHDTIFPDLDIERLNKVTKPKTTGSIHLDDIFKEDTLDFFVFFSSIAYVAGNLGQSAYAAANAFMASLAANRRNRGLAASVINIGAVLGNGVVSRELTREKQVALHKAGLSLMSEQDFHEIFAEGVLASPPGSHGKFEITTGLRLEEDENESKNWDNNPIFQHLNAKANNLMTSDVGGKSGAAIKAQLLEATNNDQVFEILKDGFLDKLRAALQADLDKPMMGSSPDALGIDSLIAVDIQSWFRKQLEIDVPVLKVLNAPSIHRLLCSAQELLGPDAVPNLKIDSPPVLRSDITDTTVITENAELVATNLQTLVGAELSSTSASSSDHDPTPSVSEPESENPGSSLVTSPRSSAMFNSKDGIELSLRNVATFEKSVPMSFAQSRFWFLKFFVEDETAFNVVSVIQVKGRIDIGRLEKAVAAVGQRHEAIRTAFYTDEITRRHMQGILSTSPLCLEYANVDDNLIDDAVQEMQGHVFNLSKGESLRLRFLSLSEDHHYMVFGYHHIALDGIGLKIFFDDLDKAYQGLLGINAADMLQYADFTMRQIQEYEKGSWTTQLEYWRTQFSELPPPLPLLPLSRKIARPNNSTYNSRSVKFRLSHDLKDQIELCCRRFKITAFHFYLAVFRVLLFRYTENAAEDICIGVADGNRKDADVLNSLGLFLNLLALRFFQNPNQTFADLLRDSKVTSDNAFANSRVPFDLLLKELNIPRSLSHSPLFQAFLNYRQNIQEVRTFCGCEAEGELASGGQNVYDISVDILDSNVGENLISIAVNGDLYTAEDGEIIKQSYLSLLQGFARNPAARIIWPPLHLEEDTKGAIEYGRGPERQSQWPSTIVDRIDEMVETYGDRIALKDGIKQSITYSQMANHVNTLALELLEHGVGSGSCVGIFQMPGTDWVCSLLAILRTGATCVPFEFQLGLDRLLLMAKDCRPSVILVDGTTKADSGLLEETGAQVFDISSLSTRPERHSLSNCAKPTDTAIITYTSGSTGVPKGVVLKHASYREFFEFSPPRWDFAEGKETVLQQSSYAFDMSILQIFTCLGYGGTLVILDNTKRRDPVAICDTIVSEGVTFTFATPTEYIVWSRCGSNLLRRSQWHGALSGGEPMTEAVIQAFRSLAKPNLRLVNCYGPAEATIGCADNIVSYTEDNDLNFTFSPLPNYTIQVVDENLNPVPAGVPGQIVIGGVGVAAGYLNQRHLTSSKFLLNKKASPFFEKQGWTMVHLSGDCGRFNASGGLVLQGRIQGSTQIKIAGIRMDLEDIENTIVKIAGPMVRQVIVSPRKSPESTDQFLVAFVVLSDTKRPADRDAFLAELPQRLPLPQYMRPSMVVPLDDIPKTTSDKVDRNAINSIALPYRTQPDAERGPSDLSEYESALWHLWEEALPRGVPHHHQIDQNTDFFNSGGSSLSLINLQILIKERLKITVPIYELFKAITLGQMAALLRNQPPTEATQPTSIDLNREVEIPPELSASIEADISRGPAAPPAIMVLTGATGFLGKEILRQLVNDDRVTKVYCIAVRKPKEHLPKLFAQSKVSVYQGDLGTIQLGLSNIDASAIFEEADVVIHAGADVSFMKTYQSLKLVNVASTKELVRLCLPRRLPLHFISSATVARLSGRESLGPTSVEQFSPNQDTEDGYTTAKWVSELYLERVNRRYGLPVVVHRPSSITGEGVPESDLMSNLMRFAEKTRAVPDLGLLRGYFDFISVQAVASTIIRDMVAAGEGTNVQGIRYMYESGEVVIEVSKLREVMEARIGEPVRVLPPMDWLETAAQAGMNSLLVVYLRRTLGRSFLFPRLLKDEA
ncbi:hypothetical protein F4779DRAFT_365857 [Xylariaceae sp. FL0662B]|nr:hypothetical protein F4779DRAFT_365857 [Xylariaceae sp. FL0662B]